jgi:hypothetical protein
MLSFRYTCARHQRVFIEAAKRGGCYDLTKMDEVRRRTLAWLSVRFPRMVLDHFNEDSCLGCKLDACGMGTAEVESVITELSKSFATDQDRKTADAAVEPSSEGEPWCETEKR